MNRLIRIFFIFFLIVRLNEPCLYAQSINLKPSIGLNSLPSDDDSVCTIPLAIDPGNIFESPGLHEGDTIPDFKLYTNGNDSVQISNLIADGKPILLVGGSYTCPKYRNHLDELSDLQAAYGDEVHIYIVYTVEAHPDSPDISPYKGEVWELNSNDQANIHYHEPITYLDRKNAASDMLNELDIPVPVLLDGPCNAWWQTFALAPNPAFLVNPNGTIFLKQGWFDNGLYTMTNAINSLLQQLSSGVEEVSKSVRVVNDLSSPVIQFIFTEQQMKSEIVLTDAMGRTVSSQNLFATNTCTFEKRNLPKGIYFYSILSGNKLLSGKVLIQ